MLNRDFHDMLSALSGHGVDYLLVGAYALAAHGLPRATGDLDLWIRTEESNAHRILQALAEFGAPISELTVEDFARSGAIFQIGIVPGRIDVLTEIDGIGFDEAWSEREEIEVEGLRIPVISRRHLLRNKRATGRPRDQADVAWLEEQGDD